MDHAGDAPVRLTTFSHGAGCACKLSPADLDTVIGLTRGLGGHHDANLLVGLGTSDDAAVYRVRHDLALVVTTDFFTPIVDDAYDWGRIAATNALSDVYAMGGTPLLALNLVAWPRETLPFDLLARVLDGGAAAASAGGCLVVGGHSIDDPEPKYGMAVVGTVHPDEVLANSGARPGDVLVLTKPLGIGAITTGLKRGLATDTQLAAAVAVMTSLNDKGLAAAKQVGAGKGRAVGAATDITGFGLVGHLHEMAAGSGVGIDLDLAAIPVLDGVLDLLGGGAVAGGTVRNHQWIAPHVDWGSLTEVQQYLVADAQTSGGLVLACAPESVDELVQHLVAGGALASAVIGVATEGHPGAIRIR